MVESSVGILVACLPTVQFLLRKKRWRSLPRPVTTTSSTSQSISLSRLGPKFTSRPAIQVGHTVHVDVAYAGSSDGNRNLLGSEAWVHNNRSEEGSHEVEMQTFNSKAEPVEAQSTC